MLQLLIICFHPSVLDSNSKELLLKIYFESFFTAAGLAQSVALDRLQNSPYFCVFKHAWAVKQNVWNVAENNLSPHPSVGRSRLASFAPERVLRHALPISLLILRKKPTVFQSTRLTADRKVSGSIPKANTKGLKITENKGAAYFALQTARFFAWLRLAHELAVPSPVTWGDVKIISSISTFVLNTLTLIAFYFALFFLWVLLISVQTIYYVIMQYLPIFTPTFYPWTFYIIRPITLISCMMTITIMYLQALWIYFKKQVCDLELYKLSFSRFGAKLWNEMP